MSEELEQRCEQAKRRACAEAMLRLGEAWRDLNRDARWSSSSGRPSTASRRAGRACCGCGGHEASEGALAVGT